MAVLSVAKDSAAADESGQETHDAAADDERRRPGFQPQHPGQFQGHEDENGRADRARHPRFGQFDEGERAQHAQRRRAQQEQPDRLPADLRKAETRPRQVADQLRDREQRDRVRDADRGDEQRQQQQRPAETGRAGDGGSGKGADEEEGVVEHGEREETAIIRLPDTRDTGGRVSRARVAEFGMATFLHMPPPWTA